LRRDSQPEAIAVDCGGGLFEHIRSDPFSRRWTIDQDANAHVACRTRTRINNKMAIASIATLNAERPLPKSS